MGRRFIGTGDGRTCAWAATKREARIERMHKSLHGSKGIINQSKEVYVGESA